MENKEKQTQVIMTQNPVDVIDLKEVFFTLLAHWKSIFLAALLGAAVFGAYHTFMLKPSYQADASIYITSTDSMISFSDLQLSAAIINDYANIILKQYLGLCTVPFLIEIDFFHYHRSK